MEDYFIVLKIANPGKYRSWYNCIRCLRILRKYYAHPRWQCKTVTSERERDLAELGSYAPVMYSIDRGMWTWRFVIPRQYRRSISPVSDNDLVAGP